jgi:hypothetical protein
MLSVLTERRVFRPYGLNGKLCFSYFVIGSWQLSRLQCMRSDVCGIRYSLLEKLPVVQQLENLPAFYGT